MSGADLVTDVRDDPALNLLSLYVTHVYRHIMRGQVRFDSPETRIKYSRDWEYPWVLLQADVRAGHRVLDCGAGYSPLMFIWADAGAEVHAIDRDTLVRSLPRHLLLQSAKKIGRYLIRLPRNITHPRREVRTLFRQLGRWRPDFWGPVPPRLLARYGVTYRSGREFDLTRLPYPDHRFDVVTCVSVLEHMTPTDQIAGIREMTRVLAPGGRFVITYDKEVDITDALVAASGLTPSSVVEYRAQNLSKPRPPVVGLAFRKVGRATIE